MINNKKINDNIVRNIQKMYPNVTNTSYMVISEMFFEGTYNGWKNVFDVTLDAKRLIKYMDMGAIMVNVCIIDPISGHTYYPDYNIKGLIS